MTTFLRVIKFGLQNSWRNFGLSAITVTILTLMLLSANAVFAIGAITDAAVSSVKNQVDVSIFFEADASSEAITEITQTIDTFPEVTEVVLKTPDEVLAEFKQRHAGSEEIQFSLSTLDENPLGATIVVKTQEPGQYQPILKALQIPEYENVIAARTFDTTGDIIEQIDLVTGRAQNIAFGVTVLFVIVAFMVVAASIRVTIFTQREEISIQKLVGASNWFIRSPFLVEIILYGTLAMIASLVLLYFGTTLVDPYVTAIFGATGNFSLVEYFSVNGIMLFGGQYVAIVLLSFISGFITMRRFLRA